MSQPPEPPDALIARYHEANARLPEHPSPALRERVLAQALAQAHAARPDATPTSHPTAANDANWRVRALASLAVLGVVGALAFQQFQPQPLSGSTTEMAALSPETLSPETLSRSRATEAMPAPQAPAPISSSAAPIPETGLSDGGTEPHLPSPASDHKTEAEIEAKAAHAHAMQAAQARAAQQKRTDAGHTPRHGSAAQHKAMPRQPAPALQPPERELLAARASARSPTVASAQAVQPHPALAGASPSPQTKQSAQPATNTAETMALAPLPPLDMAAASAHVAPAVAPAPVPAAPTTASQAAAQSALLSAVHAGRVGDAQRAIGQGARINAHDPQGFTPLMLAARSGDLPMVQALLVLGASQQPRSPQGQSALALAEQQQHSEVARWLRQH